MGIWKLTSSRLNNEQKLSIMHFTANKAHQILEAIDKYSEEKVELVQSSVEYIFWVSLWEMKQSLDDPTL